MTLQGVLASAGSLMTPSLLLLTGVVVWGLLSSLALIVLSTCSEIADPWAISSMRAMKDR